MKVCEDMFPAGVCGNKTAGFYLNQTLKENLDIAKKVIKQDWDMFFTIDGTEGGGKSVLCQQMAFFCDPTLTLDRITFRPDTFKEAVLNAQPFQAIIYDEAYGGLSSRKTMTQTNKILVDMMTEIRQKNLFIFIVLPSFFDLERYVAIWRSRALIHVYHNQFQRGFFKFYSYNKKKDLYVQGKKFYNYRCVGPDFIGNFTNFYPLNKEEYKRKKFESLRAYSIEQQKAETPQEIKKKVLIDVSKRLYDKERFKLTQEDIAFAINKSKRTVQTYLSENEV